MQLSTPADFTVGFLIWSRCYRAFFLLNLTKHEIYPPHKSKNANNVKMPTIADILTSISRIEPIQQHSHHYLSVFRFYEQLRFDAQLS